MVSEDITQFIISNLRKYFDDWYLVLLMALLKIFATFTLVKESFLVDFPKILRNF